MADDRESRATAKRVWRYPGREEHPDVDIFVYEPWCKNCGICSEICPARVFSSDETGKPVLENPEACIACYLCEKLCPEMAITVYKEPAGRRGTADKGGEGGERERG
ncbi:MAG: 4Fe-4S dicluster domain-containing protein [Candidatus Eisenbacteria bacterium]|nr:4Fe-4S dicluster domain-containing protein [Candidatus Eisenbacteria bacterium]